MTDSNQNPPPETATKEEWIEYAQRVRASVIKIKPVERARSEVVVAEALAESHWNLAHAYRGLVTAGLTGTDLRAAMGNLSGKTWKVVKEAAEKDYSLSQYLYSDPGVQLARHKLRLATAAHKLGWLNTRQRHELIIEARKAGITKTDTRWILGLSNNGYTDFDRVWDTGRVWIEK